MTATSNSVRFIKSGALPTSKVELDNSMGSIEPTKKTVFTEDNTKFKVYNCLFAKKKNETIRFYNDDGDFINLNEYQRTFKFHIFYNQPRKLMLIDTNASIVKSFFYALKKVVDLEVKTYSLDYTFVNQMLKTAKTIRFESNDQGVNSKSFNGNQVTTNQEALKAIQNDKVTSIVGILDIRKKGCTVCISKTGAIACYSNLPASLLKDTIEYPMLEFTTDVLKKLSLIN